MWVSQRESHKEMTVSYEILLSERNISYQMPKNLQIGAVWLKLEGFCLCNWLILCSIPTFPCRYVNAFFSRFRYDGMTNIFVKRKRSNIDESPKMRFDVFNLQGFCLYKIIIPLDPKNNSGILFYSGQLYVLHKDKNTGIASIIRYKIKNWDKLREYRPK